MKNSCIAIVVALSQHSREYRTGGALKLSDTVRHTVSILLQNEAGALARVANLFSTRGYNIESLNVAGMDQLRHQAKAIRDAAIGGLLQQLRYKADWYGTFVVEADRFYPSSKLCSDCGAHNAELGRELHWTCSDCGVQHDRNENAALNLLGLAIQAADELPDQLILGPVGPDVTLLDGKALAGGKRVVGETGPGEGRTASSTRRMSAVDGGTDGNAISRTEAIIPVQLQLAI